MKKDKLFVEFNQMSVIYKRFGFDIGDAATDFAALSEKAYTVIFESFKESLLALFYAGASYDVTFQAMKDFTLELSVANPYLNFYMDNFIMFLMLLHGHEHREMIPILADAFLLDRGAGLKGIDIVNPKTAANSGFEVFVNDFKQRQTRLKEDFEAITSTSDNQLTPMQRLYLLSTQGRNYLSGEFKTTLTPDYSPMPEDLDAIKATLLERRVDVVEMADIETIDDLLGYELYHTLKTELPIRKCKHCGEFFVVRGRSDMEYCDRKKPGESKPCNIIGAARTYWEGKADDPIYSEFQKAYKRNHSRRRVGTMTASEFYEWSEEARRLRSECDAGRLGLEEFKVWLGNRG
jgi:hypothetical protein